MWRTTVQEIYVRCTRAIMQIWVDRAYNEHGEVSTAHTYLCTCQADIHNIWRSYDGLYISVYMFIGKHVYTKILIIINKFEHIRDTVTFSLQEIDFNMVLHFSQQCEWMGSRRFFYRTFGISNFYSYKSKHKLHKTTHKNWTNKIGLF